MKHHNNYKIVLNHFVSICTSDERVVAAFLGGSYAKGTNDTFSDLDLYLITTNEAYDEFLAGCEGFIRLLGEPLFLEDFGIPHAFFFILDDGSECELWVGCKSQFDHIHGGAYKVLVDKKGILDGVVFSPHRSNHDEQVEILRQHIYWFWHELSHFITAISRGQLYWAYGQIEAMRNICVNLVRLSNDFSDTGVGEEPYFKIDTAVDPNQLSPLKETYCLMEPDAMRQAARIILNYYQELAPPLAKKHGIPYPNELERVMVKQLTKINM